VGDYLDSYDDSAPSLQAYDRTLVGGVVHDIPEFIAERSPITYVKGRRGTGVRPGRRARLALRAEPGLPLRARPEEGGRRGPSCYSYGEGHSSYLVDEEVREWGAVLEFLRRRVRLP
jgi:hypothetical protein